MKMLRSASWFALAVFPLGLAATEGCSSSTERRVVASRQALELPTFGTWRTLPPVTGQQASVLAVSAVLLQNSKILYFGGSQHEPDPTMGLGKRDYELFDTSTLTVSRFTGPDTDFFCAGATHLDDGKVLIVGGTDIYASVGPPHLMMAHFTGLTSTFV